jgi:phosphoglycerol transferase MdoB-like AlkP superfamily enzyme
MCESLSTYKTSLGNNKLNPTPYIKSLADSSIYFEKCFSASFGTARGLFGWLTGIPDVQLSKFSSRNNTAVKHQTIINHFDGYEKYYFLGGSTAFNNFKGMIDNIQNVKLYEEKNFKEKKVNVWGIGDQNLFKEANAILRNETKPFFAVIQTADNHEPYTISKSDTNFKIQTLDKKQILQNGFTSNEEFNAVRYFDYNVAQFLAAAKKEKYFDNTIFVFFGDHGVIGNAGNAYPDVWTSQRLTEEHIPLLFYAPKIIKPSVKKETVAQIDILPTVAGLAKQSYTTNTLGRDVLDPNKKGNYAFTIFHDAGKIGLVTDSFYFIHNYNTETDDVFSILNNKPLSQQEKQHQIKWLAPKADAIYETSKWMLRKNE